MLRCWEFPDSKPLPWKNPQRHFRPAEGECFPTQSRYSSPRLRFTISRCSRLGEINGAKTQGMIFSRVPSANPFVSAMIPDLVFKSGFIPVLGPRKRQERVLLLSTVWIIASSRRCCRVAVLPCCRVAVLPCCRVAVLPCCRVAVLPCCRVAVLVGLKPASGECLAHAPAPREDAFARLVNHETLPPLRRLLAIQRTTDPLRTTDKWREPLKMSAVLR